MNQDPLRPPPGPLIYRCARPCCRKTGAAALLRCDDCHGVRYCSPAHQTEHRLRHRPTCDAIAALRTRVTQEEDLVRNATPNAFETHVGTFGGLPSTHAYLTARLELALALQRLGTRDAVAEALQHMHDMLWLNHADKLGRRYFGLRHRMPPLMLQLDMDQECYDFVKWWRTTYWAMKHNLADPSVSFLDITNADALENTDRPAGSKADPNHAAVLLLLKLKLLVDACNIKLTRKVLAGRLPIEIWRAVELAVVRSPLAWGFTRLSDLELAQTEALLVSHACELGAELRSVNKKLTAALLDVEDEVGMLPDGRAPFELRYDNDITEILRSCLAAWRGTEGVFELLRAARGVAVAEAEDEVAAATTRRFLLPLEQHVVIAAEVEEDAMEVEDGDDAVVQRGWEKVTARPGWRMTTRDEFLAEASAARIWGYLDVAVLDAGFLGAGEKPSERRVRETLQTWLWTANDDGEDYVDDWDAEYDGSCDWHNDDYEYGYLDLDAEYDGSCNCHNDDDLEDDDLEDDDLEDDDLEDDDLEG